MAGVIALAFFAVGLVLGEALEREKRRKQVADLVRVINRLYDYHRLNRG